jgi:hypothetical protein
MQNMHLFRDGRSNFFCKYICSTGIFQTSQVIAFTFSFLAHIFGLLDRIKHIPFLKQKRKTSLGPRAQDRQSQTAGHAVCRVTASHVLANFQFFIILLYHTAIEQTLRAQNKQN